MLPIENERFYPADPDTVYRCLHAAARHLFTVKSIDEFSRSITIGTPASGFSWGANLSAQVVRVDTGAQVRVTGAAKFALNITARSPEYKNTLRLLDTTSDYLQQTLGLAPGSDESDS